jgi:hypothetical protein
MESRQVAWPGIIKYSGDAELVYVASRTRWESDSALRCDHYHRDDRLIDTTGASFRLTALRDGGVMPESTGEILSLEAVVMLLKEHAAQSGACCVAKLGASSVAEAIRAAGAIGDV